MRKLKADIEEGDNVDNVENCLFEKKDNEIQSLKKW